MMSLFVIVVGSLGLVMVGLMVMMGFRRVVSTNEVHIVQCNRRTTSYGKDTKSGNVYYEWPATIPWFGVSRVKLPVSVFDVILNNYEAYDKARLPFLVDVVAFFRITDSNVAAERVAHFDELHNQLKVIVQGAIRSILANSELDEIMQQRSKFGHEFTVEVEGQLSNWGVSTVKNIELMDIRDQNGEKVIHNIMAKKKSHIEMESRQAVASNIRAAEVSEIEAKQAIAVQTQQSLQAVGLRTVETERLVELAKQERNQAVRESEKLTKEKDMAITRVSAVRTAEINRDSAVVVAQQDKEVAALRAEAQLLTKQREADAVIALGAANAGAQRALLLAPVEAQTTLAKEIGANESYQKYLVTIRQVEAGQAVGIEQAKALAVADIKIIANAGTAADGLTGAGAILSSGGGQKIGALLEGLAQTETGRALVAKLVKV